MRWHAHYDEVVTHGGMVTAADELAAEAGAAMLRRGGNAVDGAVATAFALGVVEPEMSGLGGGTLMTIHVDGRTTVIDGAIRSPRGAVPEAFPIADTDDGGDWTVSFYDWPAVVDAVNVIGPRSVAVPGTVAALLEAQRRFGRLSRTEVMEPAIQLAEEGFEINWFLAALIASNARGLGRDRGCEEIFLRGGLPLRGPDVRRAQRLVQPRLATTLARIAADGPESFYEGEIAASIVGYVREGGGLLELGDLGSYAPEVVEDPPTYLHGDLELVGPPASGFPTIVEELALVEVARERGVDDEVLRWAYASMIGMVDRFVYMSAEPDEPTPWIGLQSPDYLRARLEAELVRDDPPEPWEYSDELPAGWERRDTAASGGWTSHHSVVDGDANAVSVTQTVLNTFGARVLDPATGVLLNDGMAYFDPRPASRNGIRPGAKAFSAMSPLVATRDGRVVAAFGASGGRRIIAGTAQIAAAITTGASMAEAVEEPRIYAESDIVLLDARWPDGAGAATEEAGFVVERVDEQPTTVHFARPNGVMVDAHGVRRSGVDPKKPGGAAVTD